MITDTAWLATIGTGHFCKLQRMNLAKKRTVSSEEARELDTVPDANSVGGCSLMKDHAKQLLQCLEKLDPDIRHAVIRRESDKASYKKIASELNITEYGAKSFCETGVESLRELMGISEDN